MRELGRILRSTRESLGFDLDQIEEKTKIRKRYLLALENGDWSVLPGRVYARGFVRSYADVLGLDGLELLQQYVDGRETEGDLPRNPAPVVENKERPALGTMAPEQARFSEPAEPVAPTRKAVANMEQPRPKEPARPKPVTTQQKDARSKARPIGTGVVQTVVILAALAVVGGGWWAVRSHHGGQAPQASAGLNNTSQVANSPTNATVAGNTTSPGATNQTTNHTATSTPAPRATITTQPFQGGVHTYLVKNVSQLKVNLQVVTGQCWIRVLADGKIVDGNDTVNTGQTKDFSGKQSVQLVLGHVQGVQLTVNGQPLQLPNSQSAVNIQIQKQ